MITTTTTTTTKARIDAFNRQSVEAWNNRTRTLAPASPSTRDFTREADQD